MCKNLLWNRRWCECCTGNVSSTLSWRGSKVKWHRAILAFKIKDDCSQTGKSENHVWTLDCSSLVWSWCYTRRFLRRFLAQHSVATLLRHCFGWLQHYSNICSAVLRIVSCNITLRPALQPRVRFIFRLVIDSWSKEPSSNYHAGRSNFYLLASPLRIKSRHKEASAGERACVRKV